MRNLFVRDEREAAVDRAGDRLAYLVVSYGLLAVVAYRGFVEEGTAWELLGLVVLGGVVGAGYRIANRAMTRESAALLVITFAVAAVLAVVFITARG